MSLQWECRVLTTWTGKSYTVKFKVNCIYAFFKNFCEKSKSFSVSLIFASDPKNFLTKKKYIAVFFNCNFILRKGEREGGRAERNEERRQG